MEVAKLLPLLAAVTPDQPSFHVVTYSLPGSGFSETPKRKGFSILQYAEVSFVCVLIISCHTHRCESRSDTS